jgi:alkanesulfonate monooxygenase
MPLTLYWFLPTFGDGRDVGAFHRSAAERPPRLEYMIQIARAAELLGFEGVLTPTGLHCEDAWLTTIAVSRDTDRLKFLVAFRPGFLSPTLAAHQCATYQRLTGGRLLLNIVTGGDPKEQRRFGDWLDHDQRYERTDEWLTILRAAMTGRPTDFEGQYYRVAGASVRQPPEPVPALYFGGSSPPAERVAARHIDVYLTWGETPAMMAERLPRMRELAAANGRQLRFGMRIHAITRDTEAEAWAVAQRILDAMDPNDIREAQKRFAASDSHGQRRMTALHGGSSDRLEVSPNLWAGIGLVRGGAGTALVGSHEQVADRIQEYLELGVEHFILSGYPHLEEAYWFGENVIPLLRRRGLLANGAESPVEGAEH